MATPNRNKITFELSRAALALAVVAGVVALLWMFVFGVFIGRRYSPDTYTPPQPPLKLAEAGPQKAAPAPPTAPQPPEAASAPAPKVPVMALCQVPKEAALQPEAERFASEMARHKEEAKKEARQPAAPAKKAAEANKRSLPQVKPAAAPEIRPPANSYSVQVGAFGEMERARAMVAQLEKAGYRAYVFTGQTAPRYRVRLGPYARRQEAEKDAASVGGKLGIKPYLLAPATQGNT